MNLLFSCLLMIKDLFRLIRWPNLLMLGAIQLFIYFRLGDPQHSAMSLHDLLIMITITMIIGAGGYVINDFYDAKIDKINKPEKWIAGNTWKLKIVLFCYFILIFLGMILSVWLAVRLDLLRFIFIYPLATAGLWLYSYSLKCYPFVGNIWVSFFCAGVVGIVFVPDLLHGNFYFNKEALGFYILFAFLSTWLREVVKDIEDVAGDTAAGCRTAVVRYGLPLSRIMTVILGLSLIASLFWWEHRLENYFMELAIIILNGATVAALALVWWAKSNQYYHYASTVIKFVMLGGTMMLWLI